MIVAKSARVGMLLRYIGRPLAFLFALDIAIAVAYVFAGWKWLALPDIPLSIFGAVIGVIAGFRNSSAYARWWEARTIWGAIVNGSRSFAREVLTLIAAPEGEPGAQPELAETQRRLVLLQVAYVHALCNQLRGLPPWSEIAGLLPEPEIEYLQAQKNAPLAIQQKMAALIFGCYRRGWIDDIRWVALDRALSTLMDSQGAAERIKSTPMPRLYDMFINLFVAIFCMLLPLGMVASLGLWTPFGSALVGLIFLAIEKIGRDLENPFENLPHDVALSAISRTIEINLKQMIGEKDVPEPLAAVDGILW
jgi:putative membrane protein